MDQKLIELAEYITNTLSLFDYEGEESLLLKATEAYRSAMEIISKHAVSPELIQLFDKIGKDIDKIRRNRVRENPDRFRGSPGPHARMRWRRPVSEKTVDNAILKLLGDSARVSCTIHKEHDPECHEGTITVPLCEFHRRQANDCRMIVQQHRPTPEPCYFCTPEQVKTNPRSAAEIEVRLTANMYLAVEEYLMNFPGEGSMQFLQLASQASGLLRYAFTDEERKSFESRYPLTTEALNLMMDEEWIKSLVTGRLTNRHVMLKAKDEMISPRTSEQQMVRMTPDQESIMRLVYGGYKE